MRAEWKASGIAKRHQSMQAGDYYAEVWMHNADEWRSAIELGAVRTSPFREPTEAAAKLAAERELRRLIGEDAAAMGGTVTWESTQ